MLTQEHAFIVAELARGGLQAASAKTPPAAMMKAWEAMHSFEAWIGEQVRAAQSVAAPAAPVEVIPEGPQG